MGKRLFAKFDKLAENLNTRDDIKLAYVNCEAESDICESNGVKGNSFRTLNINESVHK